MAGARVVVIMSGLIGNCERLHETMGNVRTVTVVMAIAAGAVLAAPPYFAIDVTSAGLRHASVGHWFRWDPPSLEQMCELLNERTQEMALLTCPPPASQRSNLQARINTVHLGGDVAVLVLAGAAWLAARRWRRRVPT